MHDHFEARDPSSVKPKAKSDRNYFTAEGGDLFVSVFSHMMSA
jgi:hypothetical protein